MKSAPNKPQFRSKTVRFNIVILAVGLAVLLFTDHAEAGTAMVMAALGNWKLREMTSEPVDRITIGGKR